MSDDTSKKLEQLMALVERLCNMPHPAPVVNVNIDLGSLARALEKRRAPETTNTVVVDHRGPTPVPG